ncbi:MAG: elongation factor P, partial [Pseudorhodoplanes sp.]
GDQAPYLAENMKVKISMYDVTPVAIELPARATLEVVETEPTIKSQTASSSYKPAKLENGLRVLVPPFITAGEKIIVDTNEVTYVRRAD